MPKKKLKNRIVKPKIKSTGCCKPFNPKPWNGKKKVFKNKKFVKAHYFSLFHIPINMGSVMVKTMNKINQAKAGGEYFMMVDEKSMWGADIYIAVKKNVPGLENVKVSGTFLTKVYEGLYNKMGEWIQDMNEYVKKKKKKLKKLYFYYTMCPACAKDYGQDYTVILAKI